MEDMVADCILCRGIYHHSSLWYSWSGVNSTGMNFLTRFVSSIIMVLIHKRNGVQCCLGLVNIIHHHIIGYNKTGNNGGDYRAVGQCTLARGWKRLYASGWRLHESEDKKWSKFMDSSSMLDMMMDPLLIWRVISTLRWLATIDSS